MRKLCFILWSKTNNINSYRAAKKYMFSPCRAGKTIRCYLRINNIGNKAELYRYFRFIWLSAIDIKSYNKLIGTKHTNVHFRSLISLGISMKLIITVSPASWSAKMYRYLATSVLLFPQHVRDDLTINLVSRFILGFLLIIKERRATFPNELPQHHHKTNFRADIKTVDA